MSDALDNLKFAYALSEAALIKREARIKLLENSLNHALIQHCKKGVLGPDSRCTPDWFVELSAVQCGIQKTELKCQLNDIKLEDICEYPLPECYYR